MSNRDIEATWEYHNSTKHSHESIRANAHSMDWLNQPLPFKIYQGLESIPLPQELEPSDMPALSALSATGEEIALEFVPDMAALTRLFHYSAGITKKRDYGGGEILFRAAACTGALYHIELYLVCGDLPGLAAGVYHFSPHDQALRRLRSGDYRSTLLHATANEGHVRAAPGQVVFTGVFWRNAWKYQTRTYRHTYWDSGTILANFQTVAAAHRIPAQLVLSFIDEPVNRLLDLDTEKEVAVAIIPLGCSSESIPDSNFPIRPLGMEIVPLSRREVDYPAVRAMHASSCLATEEEVAETRGTTIVPAMPAPSGRLFGITLQPEEELPTEPIETVIQRRGSTRRFSREAITFAQLSTILHRATVNIQADFLEPPGAHLSDLYLTVHAVQGIPAGAYVYHRDRQALELLMEGDFRTQSGYLGLEQELPADASANIFFLTDLDPILRHLGNRGYRAAQLEASITAGKAYLAAYAQRLGATGLTFYDDDVTQFFSPHAEGKSIMFLVAIGHSVRRRPA